MTPVLKRYRVRLAEMDDVAKIIPFIKQSWARTYDPVIGVKARKKKSQAKHVPALFESEINDTSKAGLVAVQELTEGIEVIGYAGGEMRGEHCFFVDHLHVAPDWQGSGVALALIEALGNYLVHEADWRPNCIELTVLKGNERAIGFYRKAGFVVASGANEDDGLGGQPSQLMRLTIRNENAG